MNGRETVALWGDFKEELSRLLGVPQSGLHIAVGLLLYPLFARWMGVRWGSWKPLLPILALELLNEGIDLLRYVLSHWPGWSPVNALEDIAATLLPVALAVLAIRVGRRKARQIPQ